MEERSRPYAFSAMVVLLLAPAIHAAENTYWVPIDPPKSHYVIDARLDVETGRLTGGEQITLRNGSRRPIGVIAFQWALDDQSRIEVIVDGGQPLGDLNTAEGSPADSPLFYRLPEPLAPGDQIELQVTFGREHPIDPERDEILTSGWWYPRLWWDGLPIHDSFAARLRVPDDYAVAISGRLNPETGYFESAGARACGFYLGRGLKTLSREVEGVQITALFREEGERSARVCLQTAADAVAFYKSWLGFYPFDFLYLVPGGEGAWGGYPMSTGIVVIHGQQVFDSKPLLHWQWITAHEIGHQYWGEWVLDPDDPSWLWIGLGVFADREYSIHAGLDDAKHTGMMSRFIEGTRQRLDTTIAIPPAQFRRIDFDFNNVVIHGKGFSVISMLDQVLGRETFMRVYRRCLREYGGRRLGFSDFRRVCEEETGQSLAWFFEPWIRGDGFLALETLAAESEPRDGGYLSTVRIRNTGEIRMPVPVKVVFEDGSSQRAWTHRNLETSALRFSSATPLTEVVIDPDRRMAIVDEPPQVTVADVERALRQLAWTGDSRRALEIYAQANDTQLPSPRAWFKLGMTLYDGRHYTEAREAFARVTALAPTPSNRFICNIWLGHLCDLQGARQEALAHYRAALAVDHDEVHQHSQYDMKIDRAWAQQRLQIPFRRERE